MYRKMFTKTKKSNGSPRARISRILRSFVLLLVPMGTGHMLSHGSGTQTFGNLLAV